MSEPNGILTAFEEFKKLPNVVYSNVTDTLRARNAKTKEQYNRYYNECGDHTIPVEVLKNIYKTITYDQMPFIPERDANGNFKAVYITHTNMIEHYLYLEKCLASNPDVEIIPKGDIASDENPVRGSHPIMSQWAAEDKDCSAYFQIANIASPTRYQGSEVTQGNKLYYIISDKSKITLRELYTVITRLWDIDDLVIVICNEVIDISPLKTFHGLPIKTYKNAHIDYDFEKEGGTKVLSNKEMDKYLEENFPDTDEIYYNKDYVFSNEFGDMTKAVAIMRAGKKPLVARDINRKTNAKTLCNKAGAFQFSYMPMVYRVLEKHGLQRAHVPVYLNKPVETHYAFDLTSAFPQILKFGEFPIEGILSYTEDPNKKNFYRYKGKVFTNNSTVTEPLVDDIRRDNLGELEYMFSVPKKVGCEPGEWLYQKAHKSKESKEAVSGKYMKYGILAQPMLAQSKTRDCYIIRPDRIYELVYVAIHSEMFHYMYNLKKAIDGVYIKADAVHFDSEFNDELIDKINSVIPSKYEWKIFDHTKGDEVIYMNYESLKTRNQIKNECRKARRAAMTPEELEEERAKERERQRKYREKKKIEKDNQI